MKKIFLTQPAILSCLGEGVNTHVERLLQGGESSLKFFDDLFAKHEITKIKGVFGEISQPLRPFPESLPLKHHSRNNQVLWHALMQLEHNIQRAIERFGRSRIAVVIGTSTTGIDENIPVFKAGVSAKSWDSVPFNPQQIRFSAPADFIAEVYGLTGLVYGISTACTSGARALISAARLLKSDLCDAVICGGVDTLSPLTVSGFDALSVLSEQQTNPFSQNRNGINIGEGGGLFIMSKIPLDDHTIQLLGYGSSSDAYHMSSPHPAGEGAIAAFEEALNSAQLSPMDIRWINLHGTGTYHNDQMESFAVAKIFGDQTPCTTTKPYTGHTLGAAGAVEAAILWGVMSSKYNPTGKLPPQLWDQQADILLPHIALTGEEDYWTGRRIGASSSFAFGGNNTVLIMGELNE